MGKSDDWDQWYLEFATSWIPHLQRFVDKYPSVDVTARCVASMPYQKGASSRGDMDFWRWSRQYIPVPQAVVKRLCEPAQDDMSWLIAALGDERRWFIARLATVAGSLPETLLEPMLISAAEAEDPSLNGFLIRPCVASFGAERVRECLVALAESADPDRVYGALAATYWTGQSEATSALLFERRWLFLLDACVSGRTSTYTRNRILFDVACNPSLVPESHRESVVRAQALRDEEDRRQSEKGR